MNEGKNTYRFNAQATYTRILIKISKIHRTPVQIILLKSDFQNYLPLYKIINFL
jgi:hypothetical protein